MLGLDADAVVLADSPKSPVRQSHLDCSRTSAHGHGVSTAAAAELGCGRFAPCCCDEDSPAAALDASGCGPLSMPARSINLDLHPGSRKLEGGGHSLQVRTGLMTLRSSDMAVYLRPAASSQLHLGQPSTQAFAVEGDSCGPEGGTGSTYPCPAQTPQQQTVLLGQLQAPTALDQPGVQQCALQADQWQGPPRPVADFAAGSLPWRYAADAVEVAEAPPCEAPQTEDRVLATKHAEAELPGWQRAPPAAAGATKRVYSQASSAAVDAGTDAELEERPGDATQVCSLDRRLATLAVAAPHLAYV